MKREWGSGVFAVVVTAFLAPSLAWAGWAAAPSVIAGAKVQPEEAIAGSVVRVQMTGGSCTGTLLGERTVLTASHCPDMGGAKQIQVSHVGGTKACKVGEVAAMARPVDARFDSVRGHYFPDMVLLKLAEPICDVTPAQIYSGALREGDVITAAGYGRGTTAGALPDRLDIEITAPDTLVEKFYDDLDPKNLSDAELIGSLKAEVDASSQFYSIGTPVTSGQSLCNGDSGGPAYVESQGQALLVGVNGAIFPHPKKGASACKFAFLQLVTPVSGYVTWIENTTKTWEGR